MKELIYLSVFLLFFSSCSDSRNDLIQAKMGEASRNIGIKDCSFEISSNYSTDGNSKKLTLFFNYDNTNQFVHNDQINGRVAFDLFCALDSSNYNNDLSYYLVESTIDNESHKDEFTFDEMRQVQISSDTICKFLDAVESGDTMGLLNMIDTFEISRNSLNEILDGVRKLSICGPRTESYLVGFGKEEYKEKFQIDWFNKRNESLEVFNFIFNSDSKKIIYINAQSTMGCIKD